MFVSSASWSSRCCIFLTFLCSNVYHYLIYQRDMSRSYEIIHLIILITSCKFCPFLVNACVTDWLLLQRFALKHLRSLFSDIVELFSSFLDSVLKRQRPVFKNSRTPFSNIPEQFSNIVVLFSNNVGLCHQTSSISALKGQESVLNYSQILFRNIACLFSKNIWWIFGC
jgi:hypothetical protein